MSGIDPGPSGPLRGEHVRALDGVRGVAVALIVVHHVVVRSPDPAFSGWPAVDLFFGLSGFLITQSILSSDERARIGEFFRRRFWRLMPALFVVLAVYAVASIGADDAGQRQSWALAAALQWINVQAALEPPFSPHLAHLWSISAEVQFYVVWAALLVLLVRLRTPRPLVAVLVVALFVASAIERNALWHAGEEWNRLYFAPDTRSAALVAGCLAGLAHAWGWLDGVAARWGIGLLALPSAAMFAWTLVEVDFLDGRAYRWVLTVVSVAIAVLVLSAALRSPTPLRPVLELWPVAFLGRISYSLYLVHLPIIEEVARRRHEGDLAGVALIALPLSLVVALASWALVERPLMRSATRARLRARLVG